MEEGIQQNRHSRGKATNRTHHTSHIDIKPRSGTTVGGGKGDTIDLKPEKTKRQQFTEKLLWYEVHRTRHLFKTIMKLAKS